MSWPAEFIDLYAKKSDIRKLEKQTTNGSVDMADGDEADGFLPDSDEEDEVAGAMDIPASKS